jgi:hypothetical protein
VLVALHHKTPFLAVCLQVDGLFLLCSEVHGQHHGVGVQCGTHSRWIRGSHHVPTGQAPGIPKKEERIYQGEHSINNPWTNIELPISIWLLLVDPWLTLSSPSCVLRYIAYHVDCSTHYSMAIPSRPSTLSVKNLLSGKPADTLSHSLSS